LDSILDITASGAWNGGKPVDNSIYEDRGMFFKRGIPVTGRAIEERIGVRKRMSAGPDEKIGLLALEDLLKTPGFDPARIKILIGATNIGENRYDTGPLIRHPYESIKSTCPDAMVLDLYAGCPGFNVSAELIFVLTLAGILGAGDMSVVVGAENLHRERVFRDLDTSNIIFGDDAMATALESRATLGAPEGTLRTKVLQCDISENFVVDMAKNLFALTGRDKIDGLIVDNQLGKFLHRVPAAAARVQHALVELQYPEEVEKGTFSRFKDAMGFYNRHVNSFAFDIMTLSKDPEMVEKIAAAYVTSGKYNTVASVFLSPDGHVRIAVFCGSGYDFTPPASGIVDTHTSTHGCFAHFIQAVTDENDVVGEMDGKGVFLHATRGAGPHLKTILSRNHLSLNDIDLLVEHQANFAMIPLTLDQVLPETTGDRKERVINYLADKMINNIHNRGNCSVVCMQRLPYDLSRDALEPDTIQGFPVNRNIENLKNAKQVLYDSVGSGMTRSSVLIHRK
jgi:3-oxoacyl-[acyl-carrier-protein] synthase III